MARSFGSGSNYLSNSSAVLTGYSLAMACWFKMTNTTGTRILIAIQKSDGTNNNMMRIYAQAGTVTAQSQRSGGSLTATSSATYSANTWAHVVGQFNTDINEISVVLNGGTAVTTTAGLSPLGMDKTYIGFTEGEGAFYTPDEFSIAEAAIWNISGATVGGLKAGDIAALAAGASPLAIKPAALAAYWPLWGTGSPEIDPVGGYAMTLTGAMSTVAHQGGWRGRRRRPHLKVAGGVSFDPATFPWPQPTILRPPPPKTLAYGDVGRRQTELS